MKELIAIQRKLKAPKNQYNSFGKYKYRNAEDILEGLKPLLEEYGCTLTISDRIEQVGERYYIAATATICSPDGQSLSVTAYAREAEKKSGMDESQITGSCSSYARKYALNGLFLIDDTKDADTDEQRNQIDAAKAKKSARKTAADKKAEEEDEMKAAILADINKMNTREELRKIWDGYKPLQKEEWFIEAVSERGHEIAGA